jgi:hypothetical protein
MPWWFSVALFVGPLALVATVLWIVFSLVRKAIARAAAALGPEGIELDSGPITVTTRYRKFRAPRIYSSGGVHRGPSWVVLTKRRLHILKRPQFYGIIERESLGRFSVGVEKGRLRLSSDDPPGATGHIEWKIPVADPAAWVSALRAAGAREMESSS